jgi:BASS family bile acid:Na+ symporter
MSPAVLVRAAVIVSIELIVFGVALRSTWNQAVSLFRQPLLLLRSLLAMNIILPLFAAAIVAMFHFRAAVEVALIVLALSPVPPFLPGKQLKLVTHDEYVYGLLCATSMLAIVLAPFTIWLLGVGFSHPMEVTIRAIARTIALTTLAPFALGLFVHRFAPEASLRLSPWAGRIGLVILAVLLVPLLIKVWPSMVSLLGDRTLIAMVVFAMVALAIGHLLGGPDSDNRTVLALATASRHPGVALAIAAGSFPTQDLVPAAVLLYLLVSMIVSVPYTAWRKRQHLQALTPVGAGTTKL